MFTSETNKALVTSLLAEMDAGRLDVVDRYYDPDYVDHDPSRLAAVRIASTRCGGLSGRYTRPFPTLFT